MADIDIQKKQGPGMWPWIVGVLVLAVVVWGVLEMTGNGRTAADGPDMTAPPAAEQAPVEPQTPTSPQTPGDAWPQDPQAVPETQPPATDPRTDPQPPGQPPSS